MYIYKYILIFIYKVIFLELEQDDSLKYGMRGMN